jgi:hypothetical protein
VKICSVDGCERKIYGKTFCLNHHRKNKKYGNPLFGITINKPPNGAVQEYLNDALKNLTDDCMIWPFSCTQSGYAKFHHEGKTKLLCRFLCEEYNGAPPSENYVTRHICGKGLKGCFNPRHLEWGTQKPNSDDMELHETRAKGERVGISKLKEEDIPEIRYLIAIGEKQTDIAEIFGVSQSAINAVHTGRTWKWLNDEGGG